jgi:hypothetical protein
VHLAEPIQHVLRQGDIRLLQRRSSTRWSVTQLRQSADIRPTWKYFSATDPLPLLTKCIPITLSNLSCASFEKHGRSWNGSWESERRDGIDVVGVGKEARDGWMASKDVENF